ncbi:MAG: DUF2169 domain-containing protein [Deltaproteobacteria bacterium]|jgi:hypothetical protein|nr:DUF2169 domain-containing protein [Deltaproteobacteria bacterium]MBW2531475.1 DUF2169 domain-containing protein [Deltaproteobacteria bacterium]
MTEAQDSSPVPVHAVGQVAAGCTLWRTRGRLNVAVIAKVTLSLVPEGTMVLAEPRPISGRDLIDPTRRVADLSAIRETSPALQFVDVVVFGHAYAPFDSHGRRSATETTARLALVQDGQAVIDKTISVLGRRRRGELPEPFERIELGYERALGGIGFAENPIGVGISKDRPEELPSFVDPVDPTGRVAGFSPIPASFPVRRRLLGSFVPSALDEAVVEVPDDLDWSYLQAAPQDQRIRTLRGDEWLALDGLTDTPGPVRSRLPGATAMLRSYPSNGSGSCETMPMRADMLLIDGDRLECSVVWRISIPVASEAAARQLVLAVACAYGGQAPAWPATAAQLRAAGRGTHRRGDRARGHAARASVAAAGAAAAPAAFARPLQAVAGSSPPSASAGLEGTNVLSAEQAVRAACKPEAPFPLSAPTPAVTGVCCEDELASIPGAPWSRNAAAKTPVPMNGGSVEDLLETVSLGQFRAVAEGPVDRLAGRPVEDGAERRIRLAEQQAVDAEAERLAGEQEAVARRAAEQARLAANQEAAERRRVEAERFAAEQEAARQADELRAAQEIERRREASQKVKTGLYGAFRRRRS